MILRVGLSLALALSLVACGSGDDDENFAGIWTGTLTLIGNDCPFDGPADQSQIFPVQISNGADGNIIVQNAQGDIATGRRRSDTFSVTSPDFGRFPGTTTYDCPPTYEFGFFAVDGSDAQADLRIFFTRCTDTVTGNTNRSCALLYNGPVIRQ